MRSCNTYFCSWAKSNEKFFYWLRSRLNVDYKG